LPYVFTEHGAVMLASVLNTDIAVRASIRVVRAFVRLRAVLSTSQELARKLAALEQKLAGHDVAIRNLFDAIRQLMAPPQPKLRRIGFLIKEADAHYRTSRGQAIHKQRHGRQRNRHSWIEQATRTVTYVKSSSQAGSNGR